MGGVIGFATDEAGQARDAANRSREDSLDALYGDDNDPFTLDEGQREGFGDVWTQDPVTGEMVRQANPADDRYLYQRPETADVQADPLDAAAQRAALSQLMRAGAGQFEPTELARMDELDATRGRMLGGQTGALQQSGEEQGMGGGYASALAQGTAQQSNAMGAQVQTDRSALARARALQGMEAAGQLGSEMRRQGAAERGQRANAVDAFNEANTGYRRDVEQRDVNRQNERIGQIADTRMGRALNYDRQAGQSAARGQQYANSFTTLAKDAQKSDNRNTNPNSDGSY